MIVMIFLAALKFRRQIPGLQDVPGLKIMPLEKYTPINVTPLHHPHFSFVIYY